MIADIKYIRKTSIEIGINNVKERETLFVRDEEGKYYRLDENDSKDNRNSILLTANE